MERTTGGTPCGRAGRNHQLEVVFTPSETSRCSADSFPWHGGRHPGPRGATGSGEEAVECHLVLRPEPDLGQVPVAHPRDDDL